MHRTGFELRSVLVAVMVFTAFNLAARSQPPALPPAGQPALLVSRVAKEVQPVVEEQLAEALARTRTQLAQGHRVPAQYKLPVRLASIDDPWAAQGRLEQLGRDVNAAGDRSLLKLPELLCHLAAGMDLQPARRPQPATAFTAADVGGHAQHGSAVLGQARELRDRALAKVAPADQQFLFTWPETMAEGFGPQLTLNDRTRPFLQNCHRFTALVHDQLDRSLQLESALCLAQLGHPDFLKSLQRASANIAGKPSDVDGVTGDLLFKLSTPMGLILIGGPDANFYEPREAVVAIIDIGGDDHYRGLVASSTDAQRPFGLVIDLSGNDTYDAKPCGLATGRCGGVGMLVDVSGNDTYKMATGAGGTGFGGIGLLCDLAGRDEYIGTRFSLGTAIGGIGLVFDAEGNDRYASHGFSIGVGGPLGVGCVLDTAGDDSYQCGKHYASGYNQADAPNAKPGEPNFQYDAFGLAMGLGQRTFPLTPESSQYQLAGGLGMVIDRAGDDRYESSNFSQACGYFFGVGLKMDLDGNDTHAAARYGHASGAHYGQGLFIDCRGNDTYSSTGPTYNCGCSWDRSVFLFIDGAGDDSYQLDRSHGRGVGDIGGWGVFADLAGEDRYVGPGGYGRNSEDGLAVFFDGQGKDHYPESAAPSSPANGAAHRVSAGGWFLDR